MPDIQFYEQTSVKVDDNIKLSKNEKLTVIITIAAPIILTISLSLSIYFGLHPAGQTFHIPLTPFVHITPVTDLITLPISVPLIATTAVGIGASCIISVAVMRSEKVKEAFSKAWGSLGITNDLLSIKGHTVAEMKGCRKLADALHRLAENNNSNEVKNCKEWLEICSKESQDTDIDAFKYALAQQPHLDWTTKVEAEDYATYLAEKSEEMEKSIPREKCEIAGHLTEIVNFKTADGIQLGGYWYKAPEIEGKEAPVVILFHGNCMLAHEMSKHAIEYVKQGYSVLMPEYRGCGISEGKREKAATYRASQLDADAAYCFAKYGISEVPQNYENFNPTFKRNVLIHGYSLGGGVAAGLAERMEELLVLDRSFDDPIGVLSSHLSKGAKLAFSLVKPILSGALATKERDFEAWDSARKVKNLIEKGQKIFIIAGMDDTVIPKPCVDNIILKNKLHLKKKKNNDLSNGAENQLITTKDNKTVGRYYPADVGHGDYCPAQYLSIAKSAKKLFDKPKN